VLLARDGAVVNHKRVWRIYRQAGLSVKRRKRKRLVRIGRQLEAVTQVNEEWAIDFASDSLATGRAIRVLSVVDACTRQCLALEADTSFASRRVTQVLEEAMSEYEWPRRIRCYNGPELTSRHFLAWTIERRIELLHIQPGRLTQNGRVESFHGELRDECLNVSWFRNLFDARYKIGRGGRNTTKSGRTARWLIKHRPRSRVNRRAFLRSQPRDCGRRGRPSRLPFGASGGLDGRPLPRKTFVWVSSEG